MNSKGDYSPLSLDKRRVKKRKLIIRKCPECGRSLKAYSEKQWSFVYFAHSTLSKKHSKSQITQK